VIKYIGSKRVLAPMIADIVEMTGVRTAVDLFAGTTRVGQALRARGIRVVSNDIASYSRVLGRTYIEADERLDRARLRELIDHLNGVPGERGYVTETFCERSRYFQPQNGMRIDAVRAEIDRVAASELEHSVLLAALLEAADRVDSTVGVQMAYLKQWAPRAAKPLDLRMPHAVDGPPGLAACEDANDLATCLYGVELAYLDPPYNQHSYLGNYHVWETIVRNDRPQHYGVACKRVDVRRRRSAYNSRRMAWDALSTLIDTLPTPWVVVSFSDEGFHHPDDLRRLLTERGELTEIAVDSPRYVGARIGIHNPSGERVGTVGKLRNTELVLVSGPHRLEGLKAA
jgi:adenine-specific DNA-methyltransferase